MNNGFEDTTALLTVNSNYSKEGKSSDKGNLSASFCEVLLRTDRCCSTSICCLASARIDLICSEVKSCGEMRVAEKSILIRLTVMKHHSEWRERNDDRMRDEYRSVVLWPQDRDRPRVGRARVRSPPYDWQLGSKWWIGLYFYHSNYPRPVEIGYPNRFCRLALDTWPLRNEKTAWGKCARFWELMKRQILPSPVGQKRR